jgi:hypothetical protein
LTLKAKRLVARRRHTRAADWKAIAGRRDLIAQHRIGDRLLTCLYYKKNKVEV